jgi:hypothetical protein
MPIKPELRWFYPADWAQISRRVRFERAGGTCEGCGRPHGETVRCLPDGRWFDGTRHTWRSDRGRPSRWPDLEDAVQMRQTRVILAAAHLDHDPSNNRLRNLKSLCQRCHLIHDRPHHLARRRITYLLRRALGDLFLGPYSAHRVPREIYPEQIDRTERRHGLPKAVFAGRRHQARRYAAPFGATRLDCDAQQKLKLGMQ